MIQKKLTFLFVFCVAGEITRHDTWLFTLRPSCDVTGWSSNCGQWEEITSSESNPKGRYFHAVAKIKSLNEIVLYGGFGNKNMWGSSQWYFTTPSSPNPREYGKPYLSGKKNTKFKAFCFIY
tara:strand:+ start:49 stop:414 length:366 start_codon:yes stop_codon:yes gene_type:complete